MACPTGQAPVCTHVDACVVRTRAGGAAAHRAAACVVAGAPRRPLSVRGRVRSARLRRRLPPATGARAVASAIMRAQQRIAPAGSADGSERRPTVTTQVTRPPGERGLAEMYSDRMSQGRAPASPRDHIIFGGNRANHQAGTKFASGGFPYLFVIVSGRAAAVAVCSCVRDSCPLTIPASHLSASLGTCRS